MATSAEHFEVEQKYRTRKARFAALRKKLLERGFTWKALVQTDHHIKPYEVGRNRRVRKQESVDGVEYFHTDKHRVDGSGDTRREAEREISRHAYAAHVRRVLRTKGLKSIVRKERIQFDGEFRGRKVTVCIDDVTGVEGAHIGYFVEFECLVEDSAQIARTEDMLEAFAKALLPSGTRREYRSYRRLARITARKVAERRRRAA